MLYKTLDQITNGKDPKFIEKMPEDERKKLNPFILNLWLSMNSTLFPLADLLNQSTFNLTLEQYYQICRNIIPKHKAFFPWIKTKKDKAETHPFWLVDIIVREFKYISKREAKEYIDLLLLDNFENLDFFINILRKYPIEDKQKKHLKRLYNIELVIEGKSKIKLPEKEVIKEGLDEDLFV
jgi:hypothetical protein